MSDYLCEELIHKIFTRLPLESLLRFRSLSKKLCSIISSPGFTRMHALRTPQKLIIIRHRTYYKDYNDDADFCTLHGEDQLPLCPKRRYIGIRALQFPFSRHFSCVGSCNGILCLFDFISITLWNPSIRRKLTLTDCPWRCFYGVEIGFGFDPSTDDYKIVSMFNPNYGGMVESSFVYAMKTRTWCAIASPTPLFSNVASKACFVNGALHWVVKRHNTRPNDINNCYILTFNLSTHVFGMIALPDGGEETSQLTTFQDSLATISMNNIDVWIWVRRDASWVLVSKLEINKVQGGFKRVSQPTSNGYLLLKTFLGEIHIYNPKTLAQSRLVNLNAASHICDMEMCVASLELLDIGTASHRCR